MGEYLRKNNKEEISVSKVTQPRVIQLQTTARVRFATGACHVRMRERIENANRTMIAVSSIGSLSRCGTRSGTDSS